MVLFALFTALACVAAGAIAWFVTNRTVFTDYMRQRKRITPLELGIGSVLICLVVVPLCVVVGKNLALSSNLTYHEYWNGYETQAIKDVVPCSRDGSCHYEYDCDHYTVAVTRTRTVSDGRGGTRTETYTDYEERHHDCPYATEEWVFSIDTTLGSFDIERTFSDNPQPFRSRGLPGNVRQGTPPFWQAAYDRLAAGDPGPVTVRRDYDNYILASQSSILREYSEAIETYADVLPPPASEVRDFYYADKAYFVGIDPVPGLNDAVMRFNAGFGTELQGDLHVVVVGEDVTANPDEFVGALNAYWTGGEFGRDGLSKNALVVVLGADGDTVGWVRAFTGMPLGNEALLADIRREMEGLPLRADILGEFGRDSESITLQSLVWGRNTFERVCMTCKEEGGGGFGYLGSEIQPTGGQKAGMFFAAFFLSLLVWAGLIFLGSESTESTRDRIRRLGRGVWR